MTKNLSYYADLAAQNRKSKSVECDVTLMVDGEKFHAYEVSIAPQDLLFFCDKGTANYVVDIYGDKVTCELIDWEKDV